MALIDPLDPALFARDDMRAALDARDVGTVYRLLGRAGVSQRRIAALTGQAQSEVSEILKGRRVRDVEVLERIADGLGVPRGWMRLSSGEDAPAAAQEVDQDTTRRALRAATTAAALGQAALGEPIALALPTAPLPSRLGMPHVHAVVAVTGQLRGVARYYGGQAQLFGAIAELYTRWMQVPATEEVTARLAAALAELHTEAGWSFYDSGLNGAGHFIRALQLADQAGDACGIANAAWHAGLTLVRSGHPDDALKLAQLGQLRLDRFTPGTSTPANDPRLPTLTARLNRVSATAYALMGFPDQATHYLAEAHDGWAPRDAFDQADADLETAMIQLDLGQLDTAEQFAASAVRTYSEAHRRGRTQAGLLLAEVHIRAGQPQGLTLARHAINEANTSHSVALRQERLIPLATALETQPGTDTQELAQLARKIATTQI
ncbi:MAG: helix-turn-helix domain-containing protein, partial [Pseudonocardiaceae bacterium]